MQGGASHVNIARLANKLRHSWTPHADFPANISALIVNCETSGFYIETFHESTIVMIPGRDYRKRRNWEKAKHFMVN